ncbi:MAG: hypothetical protein AMXMBFR84_34650 [Candidatus Hydrogenedentota bacterium]
MRQMDHDFASELIERLEKIPAEAKPAWGKMSPDRMVNHLNATFRYSMGKEVPSFYVGNFMTKYIFGPLILKGILPIPKNIPIKRKFAEERNTPLPQAIAELRVTLDDYLAAVQEGSMKPCEHPGFGDIGIDGWAVMHVRHCEHHLKQFGA